MLSAEARGQAPAGSTALDLGEEARASLKKCQDILGKEVTAGKTELLKSMEWQRRNLLDTIKRLLDDPMTPDQLRADLSTARNALANHLKPSDLTGALRDELRIPITRSGDGRAYQHQREVNEALNGIEAVREAIGRHLGHQHMQGNVPDTHLGQLKGQLALLERQAQLFLETP